MNSSCRWRIPLALVSILACLAAATARADDTEWLTTGSGEDASALAKNLTSSMRGLHLTAMPTDAAQAQPDYPGFGSFSDGYSMGMLKDFSVRGVFTDSGEGELWLGRESAPAYRGYGKFIRGINPWRFSADPGKASRIAPYRGQYVVIKYHQVGIFNPLKRGTGLELVEIAPVDGAARPQETCQDGVSGQPGDFQAARVVDAGTSAGQGPISYSIMLQLGDSGKAFRDASVPNDTMFQCALRWLRSGDKARIWYRPSSKRDPLGQDMSDIWKIEPLPAR
ncbi:MAG: hypothetical protein NTX64_03390 [Elusimicrobia bacterium]|nr:hypothetical protein [Elusimicrobiota bacterium]